MISMAKKTAPDTAEISSVSGENAVSNTNIPTEENNAPKPATAATASKPAEASPQDSEMYTVDEFIKAAEKLFPDKKKRPSRYLIDAAFKYNGKTKAGKDEGIELITEFMNRKVK